MCLAIPGEVLDVDGDKDDILRSGRVSFGGVVRRVNFAYVPEVQVGDYVSVHVGFALSVIDATEAQRVFDYLDEIDGLLP